MKKLRKSLTIIMSMVLVMAMVGTGCVFATCENYEEAIINGISVIYVREEINGQTVCSAKRTDHNNFSDIETVKTILVDLGMRHEAVDILEEKTLVSYSESSFIVVCSSYERINEFTGEVSAVSRQEAEKESELINRSRGLCDGERLFQNDSDNNNRSPVTGSTGDSYRTVSFSYANEGDDRYTYTTSVVWMTMPYVRGYDSLGSLAMNNTVTDETRSATYSYSYTLIDYTNNSTTYGSTGTLNAPKYNKSSGNWYGSGGSFYLPSDSEDSEYKISFYDYAATYSYSGHYSFPDQSGWFNAIGTHSHALTTIANFPGLAITIGGAVSASVNLQMLAALRKDYSVEFEIHYIP